MHTLRSRYKQANKEAKWALLLTVAYFVWWYICAYEFSPSAQSVVIPELYFGLPLWFLLSCIVGPILFTALCALMVKFIYQDIPLDVEQEWDND